MRRFWSVLILCSINSATAQTPPELTVERKWVATFQDRRIVDLPRVEDTRVAPDDLTGKAALDEKGRCIVHHQNLTAVNVPIVYGLLPCICVPKTVKARKFPNAITSIEGGCVIGYVKEATVLQCPKCLRAKKRWTEKRRINVSDVHDLFW